MEFDRRSSRSLAILVLAGWTAVAGAQSDPIQPSVPAAQVERLDAARQLLASGRVEEAVPQLESIVSNNPDFYRARYDLGIAFVQQGALDKAAPTLEAALAIRQREGLDEPTLFNTLGWVYYLQGDFERAEKTYLQGAALADHASADANRRLFNNLGALYTRMGRLDEAEKMYERAKTSYGSVQAIQSLKVVTGLKRSEVYQRALPQPAPPPPRPQTD